MLYDLFIAPFAEFEFMRRALAGALALALGAGPIGVFLMLRRMSLVGDAMAHAILPGAAVGFLVSGLSLFAMTAGGLIAGGRNWATPVEWRYVVLLLLLVGAFALLLLPTTDLQMGVLIVLAGLPIAPWLSCTYLLVDRLSPTGTVTEAFTWILTGFLSGQSVGASLAGVLIDASGPRMALLGATASLALAAGIAMTRWSTFAHPDQAARNHRAGRGERR